MWDPHGLTNKKCECLTKLVKEMLGIYTFILLKRGESKEQSLAMVFVRKVRVQNKARDCPLCSSPCP